MGSFSNRCHELVNENSLLSGGHSGQQRRMLSKTDVEQKTWTQIAEYSNCKKFVADIRIVPLL